MLKTLKKFYEWEKWEGIVHNILFLLILCIIGVFIVNSRERTLSNMLLFTIIISIDRLIHQNINIRNNKTTTYL